MTKNKTNGQASITMPSKSILPKKEKHLVHWFRKGLYSLNRWTRDVLDGVVTVRHMFHSQIFSFRCHPGLRLHDNPALKEGKRIIELPSPIFSVPRRMSICWHIFLLFNQDWRTRQLFAAFFSLTPGLLEVQTSALTSGGEFLRRK